MFSINKCDVETWSLQCTYIEYGLYSEGGDILVYASHVWKGIATHRLWLWQWQLPRASTDRNTAGISLTWSSHAKAVIHSSLTMTRIQCPSSLTLMQLLVSSPRFTAEGLDKVVDPRCVRDKVFLVDNNSLGVSSLVDDLIWIIQLPHIFFFFHWVWEVTQGLF